MHEPKAGLPDTYNALVYVTFCVGSCLFTLGCFLMTVPVINEVSQASMRITDATAVDANTMADLQASWQYRLCRLMTASLSCTALASSGGLTSLHGSAGLYRSRPSVEAPERSPANASAQVQVVFHCARLMLAGCDAAQVTVASFDAAACCVAFASCVHTRPVLIPHCFCRCRWLGFKPHSISYWGGVIYTFGAVL